MSNFATNISEAELEELTALPRWQPLAIPDRAAFFAAHPECRVDAALLNELSDEIHSCARNLDPLASSERRAEITQEIVAGILDCATQYRRLDPVTGTPIFDFLAQTRGYVVRHAAGKVSSEIRRERRAAPTVTLGASLRGGNDFDDGEDLADDVMDADSPGPEDQAMYSDLVLRVNAQLNPDQRRVFALMVEGHQRPEIGQILGLARQRVHEYAEQIRPIMQAALEGRRIEPAKQPVSRRRPIRQRAVRIAPARQAPCRRDTALVA
jgi:DNA-directed RNA polymerase specialized sigma24 family protein